MLELLATAAANETSFVIRYENVPLGSNVCTENHGVAELVTLPFREQFALPK